jgi:sulfide dehydrogenase cytochrome subunit
MRTTRTAMLTFVWAALTLPFAATAVAADLEELKSQCSSCHGPGGNSPYSDVPTIANSADKCQIAGALSPEDINAAADYYSKQPFKPAGQPFDAARAAGGAALHDQYCETCHHEGGKANSRAPRLAGQWKPYLRATLKFVPTGEHLVPPMMERRIVDFSAEEINQLLDYYASQQD